MLKDLIVSRDLHNLNVRDLRTIAKKLHIDYSKGTVETFNKIGRLISNQNTKTLSVLSNYTDKIFVKGSVSWFHVSSNYLDNLKTILSKQFPQVFNNHRIYPKRIGSVPILFGMNNFKYVNDSYILRYTCRIGSHNVDIGGQLRAFPRMYYATVIVVPKINLLEVRASRRIVGSIVNTIRKYFGDNDKMPKDSIKQIQIGSELGFETAIKEFRLKTGAKLNEVVSVPSLQDLHVKKTNIPGVMMDLTHIMATIDNRISKKTRDIDVNDVIDKLHLTGKLPNIPFPVLLLSGLSKVDIKSILKMDLAKTPLYSTLKKYSRAETNSVKLKLSDGYYYLNIGRVTNTVSFYKKSNENLVNIVRNDLILQQC